jgi:hypothetical protein
VRCEVDDLMTDVEVGARLGVAVTTLQQWRHRGKGPPFIKEGVWVRYRREDVEAWLSARRGLTPTKARRTITPERRAVLLAQLEKANANLTPEQRRERARTGAQARWAAQRVSL